MDLFDDLGLGQKKKFKAAFEVLAFPITKPFPAVIGLGKFMALDHRAHCAIEHNGAFAQERLQRMKIGRHSRRQLNGVCPRNQETNLRIMMRRCVWSRSLARTRNETRLD